MTLYCNITSAVVVPTSTRLGISLHCGNRYAHAGSDYGVYKASPVQELFPKDFMYKNNYSYSRRPTSPDYKS